MSERVNRLHDAFIEADIRHWGVLTIGTGLGNAAFTRAGDES